MGQSYPGPLMRGSPSCSISALTGYHNFRIRSDQSIKYRQDDRSQGVSHRNDSGCIAKQRRVAKTSQPLPRYFSIDSAMGHCVLRPHIRRSFRPSIITSSHTISRRSVASSFWEDSSLDRESGSQGALSRCHDES